MSEQTDLEKSNFKSYRPIRSYGVLSNTIFGFVIRVSQFITTILVLALSGDSLNRYATSGSMGFTIFSAVFTLIYLILFTIISLIFANELILGINLLLELLIKLFWFVSFIAIAAVYGPDDCSAIVGYGWYRYTYVSNSCKSSKAAIAFAAINFVLFFCSFLTLTLTSFRTLPTAKFWVKNGNNGVVLNKPLLAVTNVGSGDSNDLKDVSSPVNEQEQ